MSAAMATALERATTFLDLLFPETIAQGFIEVRTRRSAHGATSRFFADSREAAEYAVQAGAHTETYIGVGLRRCRSGKAEDVATVTALWADLDGKDHGGKAGARAALDRFPLVPNIVVDSGGGYHAYWRLDAPLDVGTTRGAATFGDLISRVVVAVGGDPSCKDVARILRPPGTRNHKYNPQPDVTAEYPRAERYTLAELDAALPALPPPVVPTPVGASLSDRPSLDQLREMLGHIPPVGAYQDDWLRVLMAIHSAYPGEEGIALAEGWSPGKPGEIARKFRSFKRQHGVTIGTLFHMATQHGWRPATNGAPMTNTLLSPRPVTLGVRMSEVKPEQVAWLLPGRIVYGGINLIDGDPGLGKSLITLDLVARLTRGWPMPDGTPSEAANVIIVTPEDHLSSVIQPRLEAAGADLTRIISLSEIGEGDERRLLSLPGDLPYLAAAIEQEDAKLVIIDPLMAIISGDLNSYKDQDVRRMLNPLGKLAEHMGVAVIIVRHLVKGIGGNALYRGGGSIGIIGAARSALMVGKDPENDEQRILAHAKGNLSAPPSALVFRIEADAAGNAHIVWLGESHLSAQDLVNHDPGGTEGRSALDEARDFLLEQLADGGLKITELQSLARKAGISEATLRRAKDALGIKPIQYSTGADRFWKWQLDPTARSVPSRPPDAHYAPYEHLTPGDSSFLLSPSGKSPGAQRVEGVGQSVSQSPLRDAITKPVPQAAEEPMSIWSDTPSQSGKSIDAQGQVLITRDMSISARETERLAAENSPAQRCHTCRQRNWWQHPDGRWLCGNCYPPPSAYQRRSA